MKPQALRPVCALVLLAAQSAGCGSSPNESWAPGDAGALADGGSLRDATGPVEGGGPSGDASADSAAGDDGGADAASDSGPPTSPVTVDHACSAGLHLVATLLDDGVARLHYVSGGVAQPDRGWTFDLSAFAGPHAPLVEETPTELHLRTATIDVVVAGANCSIAITSVSTGESLWAESAPYSRAPDGTVALGRAIAPSEAFYGLGEKSGPANRFGHAYAMWNTDEGSPASDPIYQSNPYFLSLLTSGHATGAYLANTHRSTFDVGAASPTSLAMGAAGGDIDLFFFDGPKPAAVLEEYTRLVGRAPLPPLWALGYHQSRWTYQPASHLEDIASKFRQLAMPADCMWLDIDYMDGFRDFTWNPTSFADPSGLVSTLASSGFHLVTIVDPGVKYDPGGTYGTYNDGVQNNVFIVGTDGQPVQGTVWPGAAVFPDFTSPAVRSWWGRQGASFASVGLSGLWLDMNEPQISEAAGFPSDLTVNGEGTAITFAEARNVYALLEAKATRDAELAAAPDKRTFILTRAGFSGIQKYAAVWTGDALSRWDYLANMLPMLQGMEVSGIPFVGSDVGGFTGGPGGELYGRWFEVGSFSPFFRTHSTTGSPDQEPWAFGPEIQDLAQRMLAIRYSLLPYWYESFVEANDAGLPVVRPLWFEYPEDAETQNHVDEFFVGDSILVAPVVADLVTQRDVYVPSGVFHDFYTGATFTGPATVTLPAPLGRIPMLVRGGSIVPEIDVQNYAGEHPDIPRHLDVYPGAPGTTAQRTLHEDDGESLDYLQGAQSTIAVGLDVTTTGLTLSVGARSGGYTPPVARAYDVRIHGVATQPSSITVNGAPTSGTWTDESRTVVVPIADYVTPQTIAVAYPSSTLAPRRTVNLAFDVTLPASTPAGSTIYVASSAQAWAANGQALSTSGSTANGNLAVPEGTLVKYLITRGDWTEKEVDASCAQLPSNRWVDAQYGTNGATPVTITVGGWIDHCP